MDDCTRHRRIIRKERGDAHALLIVTDRGVAVPNDYSDMMQLRELKISCLGNRYLSQFLSPLTTLEVPAGEP